MCDAACQSVAQEDVAANGEGREDASSSAGLWMVCGVHLFNTFISHHIATDFYHGRTMQNTECNGTRLESLRSNKAALPLHRSSSNILIILNIIGYRFEDVWRCSESNQCLNLLSSQPLLWPCHVEGSRGRPSCTRWACMMLRPSDLLIPCQCWTMLRTN